MSEKYSLHVSVHVSLKSVHVSLQSVKSTHCMCPYIHVSLYVMSEKCSLHVSVHVSLQSVVVA